MRVAVLLAAGLFPCGQEASAEWGGVGGLSAPEAPPVMNPTTTDTDGDDMPDTWEVANSLNKLDPKDAASDFDMDGLTALQEYDLYGRSGGQYGKPLGSWSMAAIPSPSGFTTASPLVTLIECASNGNILARVQGTLRGASVSTSYPYTSSPSTGTWTRVAQPTGYNNVTSLTPLDVNSSGQVVGYFNPGRRSTGFLWTPEPNGGETKDYSINTQAFTSIPRRISDAGYVVADANGLGGRSVAATTNGDEITFSGLGPSPRYYDVNDYGEFIGSFYNLFGGDAQNGRTPGVAMGTAGIISSVILRKIQDILIQANIDIYKDLAYQFAAYSTGGIKSMEYLAEKNAISNDIILAWRIIDQDGGNMSAANLVILRREQEEILRQAYLDLNDLGSGAVAWLFSALSRNPVPLGPAFHEVVPEGNIAVFNDRWLWITKQGNGMWDLWLANTKAQRLQFSDRTLTSYAGTFNLLPPLR